MGTFMQAIRRHRAVGIAAARNHALAAELWNAVVGIGEAHEPSAEAVRDTAPVEHAALLATDDVAAAYAFELFGGSFPPAHTASPFELRDEARRVWSAFDDEAKKATRLAEGFGWDQSSAWSHTREVTLAGGDLGKVERIARLAGRMYASLRGARASRIRHVPEEVYSVEQGSDVARLLPSELVLLTDARLELVALERIASKRAAQYAVRGSAMTAKGPLVVALDESASMHAARNEWAKAAAVALARVASDEHRPVCVVHFSTSTVVQVLQPRDSAGILEMIRRFLGGGTDIGLALRVAGDEVGALARQGARGADVVLVTDGIDGDVESQRAARATLDVLGARLWTVAIQCDIAPDSPLRDRAAAYVRLGDHELSEGAVALFGGAA